MNSPSPYPSKLSPETFSRRLALDIWQATPAPRPQPSRRLQWHRACALGFELTCLLLTAAACVGMLIGSLLAQL